MFQNFLNINKVKLYSTNTYLGAVFAERFNRTIRDLLKKQVFEKGESNWIGVLPAITKQYINGVYTSTKLTPRQASIKKKEGFPYKNFFNKRKKLKQKFKHHDLVPVADLKRTFSKGDTTNLSYKSYKSTESLIITIPSYKTDGLKERNIEAWLKKPELTLKKNKDVFKALNVY